MLGLLRQLHPRGVTIVGCAILALAGMAAFIAGLGTPPPREQLLHLTGRLQGLKLKDARTGAFEMTIVSADSLRTFDFANAHRLMALVRGGEARQGAEVALSYFEFGRSMRVVDVVLGKENVLSYDDVARLGSEKAAKDGSTAIGLGVLGASLLLIGGLARLARGSSHEAPTSNPDTTIGAVCWLAFYGIALVVILTEPAILHQAWGTQAFHLPIEYVVPPALALVFLPLWPGCMGLAALIREAMRKGRGGRLGLLLELRSALRSRDPAERRMALKTLWFFGYFASVAAAWIVYAAILGI